MEKYLLFRGWVIRLLDYEVLMQSIKKGDIKNCYIFCGYDELLIKECIDNISNITVNDYKDLNIIKFDGIKVQIDDIVNSCETLPFFAEKKVVIVYRTPFLSSVENAENKKKLENLKKYVENVPPYTILILYYIFEDAREKPSNAIKSLEKKCTVVKIDKLKGEKLYRKVNDIFVEKGKEIGKIELRYFCEKVDGDMNVYKNEAEKLVNLAKDKDITKKHIELLMPPKNDDDIFDLVDFISQKRPEKAIDALNELINRGENIIAVLAMIERQFKLLYGVKVGMNQRKNKDIISKELKLHPFICEKLMGQSRKFSMEQIIKCLELSLKSEKTLKSSSLDKKLEMEMLIINSSK
jgi:DNA polymerase-3 subunit delta